MNRALNIVVPSLWGRSHYAFTLVELVVSLTSCTILIAGIGSAMVIATRAIPDPNGQQVSLRNAQLLADQMVFDLRFAFSFAEHTSHAVEFTVPDRNGDGEEERIRYEWSGSTGGTPESSTPPFAVCYTRNNQPTEVVATSVTAFDLTYQMRNVQTTPREEELVNLIYHDDAPKGDFSDFSLDQTHQCAQYLLPTLPTGATTWSLKRLRLRARSDGSKHDGVFAVRVTTATSSLTPASTILGEATMLESLLDDVYTWIDLDFTTLNNMPGSQAVCIVVVQTSGTEHAAKIQFEHGGQPMTPGTYWMTSGNSGQTWSEMNTDKDMRFYAYGRYDIDIGNTAQIITGVGLSIQIGTDPKTLNVAATQILNATEVAP